MSSYLRYDLFDANTTGTKPGNLTTGFLLTFSWDNGGWGAQIAISNGNIDGAIFLRTVKDSESDKIWGPWVKVWNSNNFNPDNKFGLSGIISDLNNAPLNAVFSTNGTPANAPLENAYFQGFTFAMGNNPDFKRQWAFKDKKIWFRDLYAGSWSAWTDVIPLDNYLPLSGNKMITGDFQFKDGVSVRDAAGRSVVGLLDVAGDGVCVVVGNSAKKTRIVTPNDTPVYRNDGKGAYRIYDSSNLGNATTSKAGLMSAADKTKLDGLSGGGLNIPAYIFPGDPSKLDSSASSTHITSILGTAIDLLDAFNNGRVFISKTVTFNEVQVPSDITYSLLKSIDPDNPTIFQIIMSTVVWGHYIEITIGFENNEYQAINNTTNGSISVNTSGTSN